MAGVEKVAPHGGGVVVLLDKFDLQSPGVGQCHAEVCIRRLPAVAEIIDLHVFKVEKWTNTKDGGPMLHRRLDVTHDVAVLANRAEDATHALPLFSLTAAAALSD